MNRIYPAPAKLNLCLHVTGRRDDGYHLLQTVFCLIDYADELRFAVRDDGVIRRAHVQAEMLAAIPEDEDLCVRAAKLLQRASGTRLGAEITLHKRIPLGGGLGGGSSDAATTLLALNRLWGLDWDREKLMTLGLKLGADVPFFIFGEAALAEGIGEKLAPIGLPEAWYLVLTPPVQVSTARAFASNKLTRDTLALKIPPFSLGQGHNDLEAVVCGEYPDVARYLARLRKLPDAAMAAMTGSGACVFAAFASEAAANSALKSLTPEMQGFVAQGLARHPLYSLVN